MNVITFARIECDEVKRGSVELIGACALIGYSRETTQGGHWQQLEDRTRPTSPSGVRRLEGPGEELTANPVSRFDAIRLNCM